MTLLQKYIYGCLASISVKSKTQNGHFYFQVVMYPFESHPKYLLKDVKMFEESNKKGVRKTTRLFNLYSCIQSIHVPIE